MSLKNDPIVQLIFMIFIRLSFTQKHRALRNDRKQGKAQISQEIEEKPYSLIKSEVLPHAAVPKSEKTIGRMSLVLLLLKIESGASGIRPMSFFRCFRVKDYVMNIMNSKRAYPVPPFTKWSTSTELQVIFPIFRFPSIKITNNIIKEQHLF